VIVLQHPLEKRRTLATVPLLEACLSIHVVRGRKYRAGRSAVLDDAIAAASRGERPLFVLWPGESSLDAHSASPSESWTLVAIDGTWPQAAEMARSFLPVLCGPGRLIRLASAVNDQNLMLRSEPAAGHVLTAEAVAHAAAALEAAATGDGEAAAVLKSAVLAPLRLLVALQRRHDAVGKGVKATVT
jgi:DTW domain-containing protein YfiP